MRFSLNKKHIKLQMTAIAINIRKNNKTAEMLPKTTVGISFFFLEKYTKKAIETGVNPIKNKKKRKQLSLPLPSSRYLL